MRLWAEGRRWAEGRGKVAGCEGVRLWVEGRGKAAGCEGVRLWMEGRGKAAGCEGVRLWAVWSPQPHSLQALAWKSGLQPSDGLGWPSVQ